MTSSITPKQEQNLRERLEKLGLEWPFVDYKDGDMTGIYCIETPDGQHRCIGYHSQNEVPDGKVKKQYNR